MTLAARIFSESREPVTDAEMVARMDGYRDRWRDRIWLLRENNGTDMWRYARRILELRRLITPAQRWRSDLFEGEGVPILEEAWQWNPDQILLRDYYANSLMSFDDVKKRGWPERRDHQKLLERVV